jgi:hypothetical protein
MLRLSASCAFRLKRTAPSEARLAPITLFGLIELIAYFGIWTRRISSSSYCMDAAHVPGSGARNTRAHGPYIL